MTGAGVVEVCTGGASGVSTGLGIRTRRERSKSCDSICPASILLQRSVRRSTPLSRVPVSLVKSSRMKALVYPETPDPEPRLREGRIVPINPGGRMRGSVSCGAS